MWSQIAFLDITSVELTKIVEEEEKDITLAYTVSQSHITKKQNHPKSTSAAELSNKVMANKGSRAAFFFIL